MSISPVPIFDKWFDAELKLSKDRIPNAGCLSTIGLDGFPNARFVALKEVTDKGFIITGPMTSRKGLEINQNNKVALTFWLTNTERQVRIQGNAYEISEQLAEKFFRDRNRESQIVSHASNQGEKIDSIDELAEKCNRIDMEFKNKTISKPKDWGGFSIEPTRIEFLEFQPTRFHERTLFELIEGQWVKKYLQP